MKSQPRIPLLQPTHANRNITLHICMAIIEHLLPPLDSMQDLQSCKNKTIGFPGSKITISEVLCKYQVTTHCLVSHDGSIVAATQCIHTIQLLRNKSLRHAREVRSHNTTLKGSSRVSFQNHVYTGMGMRNNNTLDIKFI